MGIPSHNATTGVTVIWLLFKILLITGEFAGVDNPETSTNSPQLMALEAPVQKGAENLSSSGLLSSYFYKGPYLLALNSWKS